MGSNHFGCVNNTIRLYSGKYLDLANPRPEDFTLADVARGLSHICRFGGQIGRFYSVAEHSCHCAFLALMDGRGPSAALACLMHDAAEAFVGDIVKPLKVMLRGYDEVEKSVECTIARKWGIDFDTTAGVVKEIDRSMLIAERRALFSADKAKWTGEDAVKKVQVNIGCWSPDLAMRLFIQQAKELGVSEEVPHG